MILQCPSCAARFIVPPQAIGPAGRRVRCARCLKTWHAELGPGVHEVVPEFVDATAGAGARLAAATKTSTRFADEKSSENADLSEVEVLARKLAEKISGQKDPDEPGRDEVGNGQWREADREPARGDDGGGGQLEDTDQPAVTGTMLPALIEPQTRFLVIGWFAWGAFVAGFLLFVFFFKEPIVEAWPPATSLYQAVGLMDSASNRPPSEFSSLRDSLKIRNQAEPRANPDGSFDLIISGTIENTTSEVIRLPRINGVLRDADQRTIYQWKVDLSQSVIGPKARLEFRTEVRSVPPETTEYEIMPDWRR